MPIGRRLPMLLLRSSSFARGLTSSRERLHTLSFRIGKRSKSSKRSAMRRRWKQMRTTNTSRRITANAVVLFSLDKRTPIWYNTRMTNNPNYDYYDKLSDPDLVKEMRTAVAVLQMSNQEDLADALSAFIDRYDDVCANLREEKRSSRV